MSAITYWSPYQFARRSGALHTQILVLFNETYIWVQIGRVPVDDAERHHHGPARIG